ncbi:MAG: acyl carrier protein [Deltaproteobacteria bacterium]|nr:acyl carrier protein [Deltaproteobacteria bacterium]
MSTEMQAPSGSRDTVLKQVISVLEDMTSDWDIDFSGDIGDGTHLVGDLAFESIDVVHLIVTLGEIYQEKDLGFEELLIEDGRYISDLQIAQLADFLHRKLVERGNI